jgi:two-component system, OmpR family, sensor kinase
VSSLRSRLFLSILLAVLLSVAITLVVGALLVRSSVRHESLKALSRQAALLAAQERSAPSSVAGNLGLFFKTQQERGGIFARRQAALLLPSEAGAALVAGKPSRGTLRVGGTKYLYAAWPSGSRAVVLLRAQKLEASDWTPFAIGFLVAGLIGAALAAAVAFVLARAVAAPIRAVSLASAKLAAGEPPGTVPERGSAELGALASAFNHMAEQLARARDAERSFLLSVSHELKTPLTAISGYAEALVEGVSAAPQAGEVIAREAKRLDRLVRDLLDLARLSQRSFSVSTGPVDLAELAHEAALRYEPQARTFDVALAVQNGGPAPAEGDPDRVLQILSNLIENALRATPAGGSVTIAAAPGALHVEDTGPGLEPDDLPRAFDRFYLHARYSRDRSVGTGLGLAIVKELTEAMGGSVTVESRSGGGTSFAVKLPRADTPRH